MSKRPKPTPPRRRTRANDRPVKLDPRKQLRAALRHEQQTQKLAKQLARARVKTGQLLQSLSASLPAPFTTAD